MIEKLPSDPIAQAVTVGQPEIIAKLNEIIEAVNAMQEQRKAPYGDLPPGFRYIRQRQEADGGLLLEISVDGTAWVIWQEFKV